MFTDYVHKNQQLPSKELVEATMKRNKEEINAIQTTENNNEDQESTPTKLMIKVPFAGDKGEGLLKDVGQSFPDQFSFLLTSNAELN